MNLSQEMVVNWQKVRRAQKDWRNYSLSDRLECIRRFRLLLADAPTAAAEAATNIHGRPLSEALSTQVVILADGCRFLERYADSLLAPKKWGLFNRPLWMLGVHSSTYREPWGVVLIIAPMNYPLFLPGIMMLQALVAGNGVVLKPGKNGSAAASFLLDLLIKSGIPKDLILILDESPESGKKAIDCHPDRIFFTGSESIGKIVHQHAAQYTIPCTLELSGEDPVLILDDADLAMAAKAVTFGLQLNGSCTCIAPKRVYLPDPLIPRFKSELLKRLNAIERTSSDPTTLDLLVALVKKSIDDGAELWHGSVQSNPIQTPFVLFHPEKDPDPFVFPHFAPILHILPCRNQNDILDRANASDFGLGSSLFTQDSTRAAEWAHRLNAGGVTCNDLIVPTADPRVPFGGRKKSGFGVTRGAEGLLEMTRIKVVNNHLGGWRPFLSPAHPMDEEFYRTYLITAHGRWGWSRIKNAIRCLRLFIHKLKSD